MRFRTRDLQRVRLTGTGRDARDARGLWAPGVPVELVVLVTVVLVIDRAVDQPSEAVTAQRLVISVYGSM